MLGIIEQERIELSLSLYMLAIHLLDTPVPVFLERSFPLSKVPRSRGGEAS